MRGGVAPTQVTSYTRHNVGKRSTVERASKR
jgi:hypothetical protein